MEARQEGLSLAGLGCSLGAWCTWLPVFLSPSRWHSQPHVYPFHSKILVFPRETGEVLFLKRGTSCGDLVIRWQLDSIP